MSKRRRTVQRASSGWRWQPREAESGERVEMLGYVAPVKIHQSVVALLYQQPGFTVSRCRGPRLGGQLNCRWYERLRLVKICIPVQVGT